MGIYGRTGKQNELLVENLMHLITVKITI